MPSLLRPHRTVAAAVFLLLAIALPAQTPAPTPAGAVPLLQPLGLAYDAQGNLFFAEAGNHVVRRLDPSGTLTTVAGTAIQGFSGDGGPALSAQLDSPHAVALDAAGNLFLADTHNHRIRRVDAVTHTITTVTGAGTPGFSGDSGSAASARLASPLGLALDPANLLYIADSANHRIRRVDLATGLITTIAGTGSQGFSGDGALATAATLDTPTALALDSAGNLFLTDTGNHRVRRIDALTHTITTIAGNGSNSVLLRPVALVLAPPGLLIADSALQRIVKLDPATGTLSTVAGQGTQAFAGDFGPAPAAMLDSPAALALTPAGAVAIADTGNQRIRQIAADGTIATVAGLGTLTRGTLSLSGATTQSYGAATLTAALSTGAASQGAVSLLDVTSGSPTLLAQTALSNGLARFTLPALTVGPHRLLATFAGDAAHQAAQSQTLALTVSPITVTATLTAPAMLFGQPIPALAATLTGVLPADISRLAATLATSATVTSAPGSYPIHMALIGDAAANYTLANPDATLAIAPAPVLTTLTQTSTALTAHVVSSTIGTPTGSITLLTSAGTRLTTVLLDVTGTATLSTADLANGSYTLTAIYSGDPDFLSAQSPALSLTLGPPTVPPDFSLGLPSLTAQTVSSGTTAQFAFAINVTGTTGLAGPIALSTTPLPAGFTANFDPPVIPPGGVVTGFTLSIATPRALAETHTPLRPHTRYRWSALAGLLPVFLLSLPYRRRRTLLASLVALALCGCGARINSTASAAQNPATTVPITITATTTNLDGSVIQHTATVILTVQ